MHRKQALEELQRIKTSSVAAVKEYNKENIPKPETQPENKRLSTYDAIRSVDTVDSPSVKETEAKIEAVKKATEMAEKIRQNIESSTSKSSKPTLESEDGVVYSGLGTP